MFYFFLLLKGKKFCCDLALGAAVAQKKIEDNEFQAHYWHIDDGIAIGALCRVIQSAVCSASLPFGK